MKYALGIDPGQTGGIALVREDLQEAHAWRYPEDVSAAAQLLKDIMAEGYDIHLAAVERVSAMPGQGVTSMFKFGLNYGGWLMAIAYAGIPSIMVTPRQWQKKMLDAGTGETKERSLNMARRLFPSVDLRYKKDDGKADALHLARYALSQLK